MIQQTRLSSFSKKQLTRREFLQLSGAMVLVLFGLGNLIAFMKTIDQHTTPNDAVRQFGFGSRKFGE